MARLSWTVTTTAGTVTHNGPEISEANMTRFRDWLWANFPLPMNPDGTAKTRNAANEAQAFREWADRQWQATKADVVNWDGGKAAEVARNAVGDLT